MEIFPYLSSYILGYAGIVGLILLLVPAPYGKFAKSYMPFPLHPRLAWALEQLGYFVLLIGYYEDGHWNVKLPSTNKGWLCMAFLIVHYLWRALVSQFVLEFVVQPPSGTKKTSSILVLLGWLYNPAVGMNFRHMVVEMDEKMKSQDAAFLTLAIVAFLANAFCDVAVNLWRRAKKPLTPYLGSYLSRDELAEHYGLLIGLGIDCPNYFFEGLEWGFFTLFAFRWEAFWYFVASVIYLLTRSIWTSHWYNLPVEDPEETFDETKKTKGSLNQRPEDLYTIDMPVKQFDFKLKHRPVVKKAGIQF